MKKLVFLLFCGVFCFICLFSCEKTQNVSVSLTVGAEEYSVKTVNSDSNIALFDRSYTLNGENTPVYTAPNNGSVFICYVQSGNIIKKSISVKKGDICVIPTNGCSIFVKNASASDNFEINGYTMPEYIPIHENASVTDITGTAGFLISHKDPESFENVKNALFSPSASERSEVPEEYIGITCSRNSKGEFTTEQYGAKKTAAREFTLMLSESYAKGFAKAFMQENDKYYINNSDTVSKYGSGKVLAVNGVPFEVTALNPESPALGIEVYDERFGLKLSPERDFEFIDIVIYDGMVTYIGKANTQTVLPYPDGYAVCFNGKDAVEKAKGIKVGDTAEAVLFEPVTTPKDYVLLDGKRIVETVYKNEERTAHATAVIYDQNFFWDSTRTNIWGVEAAFDKNGAFVSVKDMGVEDSGNTPIPEGGFVLSSGNSLYGSYMKKLKEGSTAERIIKDGAYFYRKIYDVSFEKQTEGKDITVYYGISATPENTNAFELAVDKDGYVVSASTGGKTKLPEGGYVISAVSYKKDELKRFSQVGYRVFLFEDISALSLFGSADTDLEFLTERISKAEEALKNASDNLLAIDFEYAYSLFDEIKENVITAQKDPAARFTVKQKLTELEKAVVPSFYVQDRAAWVVHYETDIEDVKHIVKYAHSLGLNRLILAPFRDTYALYNTQNPHLSRHPDLEDGVDMLQAYIDECHALGMQVYFMYGCFCTDLPSEKYPAEHFVNYFGDKLLLSKAGRNVAYFYDTPSYTLNPYDTEVRQWMLDVIREVCENYDIDGVQLDYIRFPLPTYYGEANYEDHGYNEDIVKAFMAKYGTNVNPKNMSVKHGLWDEWCDFRCDIITSFAAQASDVVKKYDLSFTCTCFASNTDRLKYVFQNVAEWVDQGIVDAVYPMIYSATLEGQMQYGDETKQIVGDKCGLVLGIGTYDGETDEVIKDQVMYSYDLGTEGNSIFALEYIQHFGFDTVYSEILYRTPAVNTDEYGKTVNAYCQQLTFMVEKVYKYCDPDVDYTGLLNEIKAVSDAYGDFDPAEKTAAEKAQYLSSVINALKDLKSKCPEYAAENFSFHVDTAVSSLTRLRNTLK